MFTAMRRSALSLAFAGALVATPALAMGAGVSPATYDASVDPGDTVHVTKTISTPEIPPKPDIVLVVDRTGSMGGAIGDVKAKMGAVIDAVQAAQPEAEFAVVAYCDSGETPFSLVQQLTSSKTAAVDAVNGIVLCDGGDTPEAQLDALWQIGSGGHQVTFRPGSTRAVAWFGDSNGHDPSEGHSLADAIASLQGVQAKVIAINVDSGFGNGLDNGGQASAITGATGGQLFPSVAEAGVADAILAGLGNLPAEVTAHVTCDAGLSITFSPALPQVVTSGDDVVLDEAVTVAADAPQGSTLTCSTAFLVNGVDAGPEFVQTVTIKVNDVTAPTVACGPGVNPAGHTPAGWRDAGFFRMVAADNLPGVAVSITDTATGTTFGPYEPGTYLKLTQAPGAAASTVVPFSGAVGRHFTFKGDATLTATDAAGNTATASCTVPPKQT